MSAAPGGASDMLPRGHATADAEQKVPIADEGGSNTGLAYHAVWPVDKGGEFASLEKHPRPELEEITTSRHRAATRVRQRRQILALKRLEEEQLQRIENTSSRLQHRAHMKMRRIAGLDRQVDKYLLLNAFWKGVQSHSAPATHSRAQTRPTTPHINNTSHSSSECSRHGTGAAREFLRKTSKLHTLSCIEEDLDEWLFGPHGKSMLDWQQFHAQRLVEHVIVAGPRPVDVERAASDGTALTTEAQLLYRYPHDVPLSAEAMGMFCFPSGTRLSVVQEGLEVRSGHDKQRMQPGDGFGGLTPSNVECQSYDCREMSPRPQEVQTAEFVFLLSGLSAMSKSKSKGPDTLYAVCQTVTKQLTSKHGETVRAEYCFCLLSAVPFLSLYFSILRRLLESGVFNPTTPFRVEEEGEISSTDAVVRSLDEVATRLYRLRAPYPRSSLFVQWSFGSSGQEPGFADPSDELCHFIGRWSLPVLLRRVSMDHLLLILGCLMTEMQVVVICQNLRVLSACVFSLLLLLRPLNWAGPVIVALPMSLHTYLESPVPLIVGVQQLPENFSFVQGMVLVAPSTNTLTLHPNDVKLSHTLIIPHASRLCHELCQYLKGMLNIRRSSRVSNTVTTTTAMKAPLPNKHKSFWRLRSSSISAPVPLDTKSFQNIADKLARDEESPITDSAELKLVTSDEDLALDPGARSAVPDVQEESLLSPVTPTHAPSQRINVSTPEDMTTAKLVAFTSHLRNHLQTLLNLAYELFSEQTVAAQYIKRNNTALHRTHSKNSVSSKHPGLDELSRPSNSFSGYTRGDSHVADLSSVVAVQREIIEMYGEAGSLFISKMMETQMFCNFCHLHSAQPSDLESRPSQAREAGQSTADHHPPALQQEGSHKQACKVVQLTQSQKLEKQLTSLFTMIMSGSSPADDLEAPAGEVHTEVESAKASRDSDSESLRENSDSLPWCNGRCDGSANTEWCTTLCLEVWQQKALLERQQAVAQDIITRHQGDFWGKAIMLPMGQTITVGVLSVKQKHQVETQSQYERRVSNQSRGFSDGLLMRPELVSRRTTTSAAESDHTGEPTFNTSRNHVQTALISHVPHGSPRRSEKSTALSAIARVYAIRATRARDHKQLATVDIIVAFLRYVRFMCASRKLRNAISVIQRAVRGRCFRRRSAEQERAEALKAAAVCKSADRIRVFVCRQLGMGFGMSLLPSRRFARGEISRSTPRIRKCAASEIAADTFIEDAQCSSPDDLGESLAPSTNEISNEAAHQQSYCRRAQSVRELSLSPPPIIAESTSLDAHCQASTGMVFETRDNKSSGIWHKSRGANAIADTAQADDIQEQFWRYLQRGISILKHGRSGKPHQRILTCDARHSRLTWRDDYELASRSLRLRTRRSVGSRCILMDDIIEVQNSLSSEVMHRSLHKGYLTIVEAANTIVIFTKTRTLDMEIKESFTRNLILTGLKYELQRRQRLVVDAN